jgi:glycosyltransferase involved in cell wall biosynthesis
VRIGYILNRFPRFSQTFVLNEILELERLGFRIDIFSLDRPPDEPRQPDLERLRAPVTYLPGLDALAGVTLGRGLADEPERLIPEERERPCGAPLFAGVGEADALRLEVAAAIVASHVRRLEIRHLHAHFGTNQTTVALLAARMAGIRYSWTAHARDLYLTFADPETDREMRRRKIAEAAFVVAVSDYNRQLLVEICPEREYNIHRIYNGIGLETCRQGLPCPGLVLAAGRLVEKKGFIYLIDACARLRDQGRQFRCEIIGDGPERPRLQQRITDLDLAHHVSLAGYRRAAEVFAAMRRASLFVLPCVEAGNGDRDGLPTVLLEALGHGLPVISSPVTGVPEIVQPERTGLLVPPGDDRALAAAIGRCLDDHDFARALGLAGRELASQCFNLPNNVAELARRFSCMDHVVSSVSSKLSA